MSAKHKLVEQAFKRWEISERCRDEMNPDQSGIAELQVAEVFNPAQIAS